jgi:hypothetical protein
MATATDTPTSIRADRVMRDANELALSAEEILFNAEPGVPFSAAQRNLLKAAGIETRHDIDRELGRIHNVKENIRLAGTAADHLAAEKAVFDAARRKQEQLPGLEKQLAEIQSQIAKLTSGLHAAQAKFEVMSTARTHLRDPRLMPSWIREQYEIDRHSVDMRYHRIGEIETEIGIIQKLATMDPASEDAQLHMEAAAPHLIRRTVSQIQNSKNQVCRTDYDSGSGWRGYVEARRAKLPALRDELDELTAKRSSELARLDDGLNFYINKL